MVFQSYEFIFGFLPFCFLVFGFIVHFRGWQAGIVWLGIASIFAYSQWSMTLAALLCASIIANYGFALLIDKTREKGRILSAVFMASILSNIAFLGYFKYINFFIDNVNAIGGLQIPYMNIILPVGISFYTFIQIGYLLDLYAGQAKMAKFSHYFLFSSFSLA